jgi:hypothetical protein
MVSAADLLAEARSRRINKVEVEGREFFVRRLSAPEVIAVSTRIREGQPFEIHEWLALGVCNEDGSPYFTAEGAAEYAECDGFDAVQLAEAVAVRSGLGPRDAAKN